MKYIVQVILFFIVLYASIKAKRQYQKALDSKVIDFGKYKLDPVTGDKAERLARVALIIAKSSPWFTAFLLLIYNILEWRR